MPTTIGQQSLLVALVELVDRLPVPPPPAKRVPGRPRVYPDRLFLKALVITIVRHLLHTVTELLSVLDQPTRDVQALRLRLGEREGNLPRAERSRGVPRRCPRPYPPRE